MLDRAILLQTLKGFAEVNRIVDAERQERLRNLSDEQARVIFNGFCQLLSEIDLTVVNNFHERSIEHHLAVRRAFLVYAKASGYESPEDLFTGR